MEKYNKGEFQGGSFMLPVGDKTVTTEINQDFTLPDYQPEIKRLLRVELTLPPPSRYISAGGAEFSGPAYFDILYAGGDGQLYSSRLSSEYDFEVPFDADEDADLSENVTVLAETEPESVVGRVLAPRRLGIRSRLRSRARSFAPCRQKESIEGLKNAQSLRRLTDTGTYARILTGSEDAIPLSDEIIPEQKDGEIRVIGADGNVFVREASAVRDGVDCRGDLILKLMICREGGDCEPETIVRKMPFSQVVDVGGVAPGWDSRAWGICSDVNVTVGEGRIVAEALMALEAEAQRAENFEFTKDIYSTEQNGEVRSKNYALVIPVRSFNGNFTQNGVFDAEDNNIPGTAEVIDVKGDATLGSFAHEKGRGVITGEVRYNIIFKDADEWGSRELTQPFRYEFDIPAGKPDGSAVLTVTNSRARMDGERISVDSEIAAAIRVLAGQVLRMVDEAEFSDEAGARRGEWVVFYPDGSDTLWGVAKKFNADADKVAAANSLKSSAQPNGKESLAGAKFIII